MRNSPKRDYCSLGGVLGGPVALGEPLLHSFICPTRLLSDLCLHVRVCEDGKQQGRAGVRTYLSKRRATAAVTVVEAATAKAVGAV